MTPVVVIRDHIALPNLTGPLNPLFAPPLSTTTPLRFLPLSDAYSPTLRRLAFLTAHHLSLPPSALSEAKALAIFHAFRGGMYFAGSSGTGIIIARLPDGSWSPPSAFSIKIASVGIVYACYPTHVSL